MRRLGAVLACVAALLTLPVLAEESQPRAVSPKSKEFQARFIRGIKAMESRDYMRAIGILERLLEDTGSTRVKLELARACFLARQYERSEQLFHEVLALPDLPWRVESNIRAFLDEIDMATGFIRFGVGIVSDSNPRNFTNIREVMIGGQSLTVVPPEDNHEVTGVRFSVRGYKPLDESRLTTAYFTASYTDFPARNFDRLTGDVGVARTLPGLPWLRAKLGFEGARFGGDSLYRFPYVGGLAAMAPSEGYRFLGEFKLGKLDVIQMPYLDADNLFVIAKLFHPPAGGLTFTSEAGFERAKADEPAYSYNFGNIGGTVVWPSSIWDVQFTFYGSVGHRRYDGIDPFFGEHREDNRYIVALDLMRTSFRIGGRRPQIGVIYENTQSTLDYYSYDKLGIRFQFEN